MGTFEQKKIYYFLYQKSWLVDEYIDKLKNDNSKVIHYNCFQSLQDANSLERIFVTSLYGNLVSQIVEQCPELVGHKNTTFGADKNELENLLGLVEEEFYLIVDGLDHISREYELHKDTISRSETEIISELLAINFPDNCHVLISSQPIDELEDFKNKSFCVFEIEPWGIEQVKSLMATFQINDDIIEDDDVLSISAYLLEKSQGNALYLSYILRELRNSDVNKELIDKIPDYDVSLPEPGLPVIMTRFELQISLCNLSISSLSIIRCAESTGNLWSNFP